MENKRTKENTLYLPIKQFYFDQIISGTKREEYREIRNTYTASRYLKQNRRTGLELNPFTTVPQRTYVLNEYNDGKFPFVTKEFEYLHLVVGYNGDRDECVVKVTYIRPQYIMPFRCWQLAFGLGEIVAIHHKGDKENPCCLEEKAEKKYFAKAVHEVKPLTIDNLLDEIRRQSFTEREKGTAFEKIIKRWFKTDPRYNNLEKVWLWNEFPGRNNRVDTGIDLVAKTELGDYWAIQCKCYDKDTTINKGFFDKFITAAATTFEDENGQTQSFSQLVWVDTLEKPLGIHAQKTIDKLEKPFTRINLNDLRESSADWRKLRNDLYGENARKSKKKPREHQVEAINAAKKHYIDEKNTRGKLIMACGTGKTYTSLKIAEELTEDNGLILFLVPSIALLGQTLNAWMSDAEKKLKAICVCSDSKVTKKMVDADMQEESIQDLAVPASTNTKSILRQLERYAQEDCRTVIFSTYQSIDVVSNALKQYGKQVDLCICDEAHRTTGIKFKDSDESNFTKVHSDENIPAKRRLYMTATPRLYTESVRQRAAEREDILCSMDDEALYGKEFHRLSFSEAVSKNLLCDYKVLVLTINESDVPTEIAERIKANYEEASEDDKPKQLQFDDATKLIGCINSLSKRIRGDKGITKDLDPTLMRRAVAFCQTINPTERNPKYSSKQIAKYLPEMCREYKQLLKEEEREDVVDIEAQHIDGGMSADERNKLLAWLKDDNMQPNECRVLCNVRCLSEGVDVPALDAVIFLSPRKSQVEVVQSVGRVMRTFGKNTDQEKKYGYIIIPIIVPNDTKPEDALNNDERFAVVWEILNALRSHDNEFNAKINQINLNREQSPSIIIGGVPPIEPPTGTYIMGGELPFAPVEQDATTLSKEEVAQQLENRFGNLQQAIYAKIVEKVGDKMYWENWAKEIGEIARKFIERIERLLQDNEEARKAFNQFVGALQKNINPSVDEGEVVEMLAQHMITQPVFDALFKNYNFIDNNTVSKSMHHMLEILRKQGFEMETSVLNKFYESVRINVNGIDNLEGKQTIIKNLYEKFFKGAFPKTVEQLGIVYTPVECVDYIIHSVDDILKKEFNTALTNKDVQILDPFVGTGTFITRLLQSGLIKPEDMTRKYLHEIFCNEIVLLAYYIADVNIEAVYHDIVKPEEYTCYDGICLTDTFQISEGPTEGVVDYTWFPQNYKAIDQLKKQPIKVIIGNPPYSIGQRSANDNAQNQKYEHLDKRIEMTYAKSSEAQNLASLYDSYIKAFRWASDKIANNDEGGIVAFISNGAWLDGNAQDGFRKRLEQEFAKIYVLNLRGNQRTSGELSRKEGGKIFGSGSRTPIAITFLIKKPNQNPSTNRAEIYYHDIGDYLTRELKLKMVRDFGSVGSNAFEWQRIKPNEHGDWIEQRNEKFKDYLPLAPEKRFSNAQSFFVLNCPAQATGRDVWGYNFSKEALTDNIKRMIDFYNVQREAYAKAAESNPNLEVIDFIDQNPAKISWTRGLRKRVKANEVIELKDNIRTATYRPFCKMNLYYDAPLIESLGLCNSLFPTPETENKIICVSNIGSKKLNTIFITNTIIDYNSLDAGIQCLPLYWYEKREKKQRTFFDGDNATEYVRHDGISDWILREFQSRYHLKNITKEDIFYYVYGLLHSKDYRETFAVDLKKSLPRIPIVERIEDFTKIKNIGKKLADLHLNYESVENKTTARVVETRPLKDGEDEYEYYRIADKMRFRSKQDKSTILYNGHLHITDIPAEAYEYVVNGKSAIEWLVERYCVKTDNDSLIVNDANAWAKEHGKPRYILDLMLSVINVSVESVKLINDLPKLKFD